ncbi:MAG: ssnA [Myxococcaceae bacterium]|nr:ssnA [Myxococcaceae bacterium]
MTRRGATRGASIWPEVGQRPALDADNFLRRLATVLKAGTLVELEPASVEVGSLRIDQGLIVQRGPVVDELPGDEVLFLDGKLVMPGLVSGHHYLHAALLRGVGRFGTESEALHQLEAALEPDDVEAAAASGAVEGLLSGVTTVFNLHASPRQISGSLSRVAHGLGRVGLRAVLGYQVSDRLGAVGREEGLEECLDYVKRARGRFRGAVAVSDLEVLSKDALEGVKGVLDAAKAFFQLALAEDPAEERASTAKFEKSPLARLHEFGLVGERTILAQGVHLSWEDLASLLSTGAWLVHAARSNMFTQTGSATAGKFGVRGCLGTDAMSLDVFAEAQAAWLKSRDAGQPIDILRFLANGHRLASAAFGAPIGPLRPGALADLMILDYRPPTLLDPTTLAAHLLHGLSARHVESVMVDGVWRLWSRKVLAVKVDELAAHTREAAQAVWERMSK